MNIINAHAHIYPDKIAAKASAGIGAFYGLPMRYDGTLGSLLAAGESVGIRRHVLHSVATTPAQVPSINEFIAKSAAEWEGLTGFAAMHPDTPDFEAALEHAERLGLRGVKLHPDVQRFVIDDPKLDVLYDALSGRLPVLVHAGDGRYAFSNPARIANVLDRFPKLDMICAHFGGYSEWDEAERHLAGRRLWVDTSSSLAFLSPGRARHLIDAFGADQVVFGFDYPMWDFAEELARLDLLNLTETEKEKIFERNIRAVARMED